MAPALIVVAGATGKLGGRLVTALLSRGAHVRALVRRGTASARVDPLRARGVEIVEVDLVRSDALTKACTGAACVVSTLLGLHEVMVDAQSALLDACVAAGVPRFIPSDFSMPWDRLTPGENRNLDLHREFQARADRAPIAVTSILNGAFMDMLTGQAPFILWKWHRVLYWQNADQPLDFTTMDDTAAFTAEAALDEKTPRWLSIAGEVITAQKLAAVTSDVTGERFTTQWAGNVLTLNVMIKIARTLQPGHDAPFPAWQGMQYSRDMFSGRGKLRTLDNARYPNVRFTPVRDVLAAHVR